VLVNTAIAGAPRVPLLETSEELMEVMFRTGTSTDPRGDAWPN